MPDCASWKVTAMRRPVDAPFKLGDGDREHAARNVGPSQDYGVPIGTPVLAMFDTVRVVKSGSDAAKGGHTLTGYAANGDYWVVQHLSGWSHVQEQREGAVVALSGDSGTEIDGPHVHSFVNIGGVRMNPETAIAQLASVTETPFTPLEEEMHQPYVIVKRDDPKRPLFAVVGAGAKVGTIANGAALRGVHKIIAAFRNPLDKADTAVEVTLSGEEWDAGTLDSFRG
jgi:hypothetical protein